MKYYYRVYGVNIESKIEIPEFEVIDSNSDIDVKSSFGVVNEQIINLITQGHRAKYEKQDMWFYIEDVAIFHIYNGDIVVIEPMGDKNTINYGFGYQKLCEDAMEKLGYNLDEFELFRGDLNVNKYIVPAFDEFTKEEVQLEVVFELAVGDVDEVKIEEILGAKKMNKLIENVFRIEMLRYS